MPRALGFFILVCVAAVPEPSHDPDICPDGDCAALDVELAEGGLHLRLLQDRVYMPIEHDQRLRSATAQTTLPPWLTTPPPTGVTVNAEGDFGAFNAAVATNAAMVLGCILVFMVLRHRYPMIYSNNVLAGVAPSVPEETYFSWFGASVGTTFEQAQDSIGLDNALMLEFCNLCMRILAMIGIPMVFVLGPMHCFLGGMAAGRDHLSYFSMGNVVNGSWLYWVHALVVWAVVVTVQANVYQAQSWFLKHRYQWLRQMSVERAHTVLVENIPRRYQSDEALKAYFDALFPGGRVKAAYVAKRLHRLHRIVEELGEAEMALHKARFALSEDPCQAPPLARPSFLGGKVEAVPYWEAQVAELRAQTGEERAQVLAASAVPGQGSNCHSGFVTFNERSDADHALRLEALSKDREECVITLPPAPSDIQWADLTQDRTWQFARATLGYVLVGGLYLGYLPCIIAITNVANLINLGPLLQPLWQALAPTLGLQFMVAFLPTFLILIFQACFQLKAAAWAQHRLQKWYFWFQIVFVVLATAVGQNVAAFTGTIIQDPFSVFGDLADTMPYATHFFMNYVILQLTTHSLNLLRYVPLMKFKAFSVMYADEAARAMSEPEDQDYYGIGSRSARWTIVMCIGLVYGTICPPINLLCFANFALIRLIYGYLLPFAECRKTDLGGVFWVTMMNQLFVGILLYCILMTGMLGRRGATWGPSAIAAPSIVYVLWSMDRFQSAFLWEKLPYEEIMIPDPAVQQTLKIRRVNGEYRQLDLFFADDAK